MRKDTFIILVLIFLFAAATFALQQDTFIQSGKASYYHNGLHGLPTSNHEHYNKNDFTAAHRFLPFNTIVSVTNLRNGKNVIVRINDRGPFNKKRIIDLTQSAAIKLRMMNSGVVPVKIISLNLLDRTSLNDSFMNENESLDCFAQKHSTGKFSVYLWETESVKHAFYMATSLALEYHNDSLLVKANDNDSKRTYQVLVSGCKNISVADSLTTFFQQQGFRKAKTVIAEN